MITHNTLLRFAETFISTVSVSVSVSHLLGPEGKSARSRDIIQIKMTDLRVTSLLCGFSSPELNTSTPESCRLFILRSKFVRREVWELRKKATASQPFHVTEQPINLKKEKKRSTLKCLPSIQSDRIDKIYKHYSNRCGCA